MELQRQFSSAWGLHLIPAVNAKPSQTNAQYNSTTFKRENYLPSLNYNKKAVTKGTVELVIKPAWRSTFVPDQVIMQNTKASKWGGKPGGLGAFYPSQTAIGFSELKSCMTLTTESF